MQKKVEVVNVRLPEKVIELLDSLVEQKLFNSRSEAVRELLRRYVLRGEQ